MSILSAAIIIISTFLLFITIKNSNRNLKLLSILFLFILLALQIYYSPKKSLIDLNSFENDRKEARLREYPPLKIPIAHWIEGRKESLAIRRIAENTGNALSINYYFFANHPRETPATDEIEKYPYIMLPFFLVGLLVLLKDKNKFLVASFFLFPIMGSGLFGVGKLGPIALFPIMTIFTAVGLKEILKKNKYSIAIWVLIILVWIQSISYAFT